MKRTLYFRGLSSGDVKNMGSIARGCTNREEINENVTYGDISY
jgi:hypothetical protein